MPSKTTNNTSGWALIGYEVSLVASIRLEHIIIIGGLSVLTQEFPGTSGFQSMVHENHYIKDLGQEKPPLIMVAYQCDRLILLPYPPIV